MFNSETIMITVLELNNGMFVEKDPLIQALYNLHLDIIRTEIDMWQDMGGTDEDFVECFEDVFPTGFLRRDIQRAKNVLYDLYDIAVSPVLRFELSPVNTYVMHNLIARWFDAWSEDENIVCVPRGLKTDLRKRGVNHEELDYIVKWFTDRYTCADDFAETYNADYVSGRFAEEIAYLYLQNGSYSPALQQMGVTIDEFFDLLPNDLRELCINQYEREKSMINSGASDLNKNKGKPVAFISYSWDDEKHKRWVKELADRLSENNINSNT